MQREIVSRILLWTTYFTAMLLEGLCVDNYKILDVKDLSKHAKCESGLLASVDSIILEVTLELLTDDPFVLETYDRKTEKKFQICSLSNIVCPSEENTGCYCKSTDEKTYIIRVEIPANTKYSLNTIVGFESFQLAQIYGEEAATLHVNEELISLLDCTHSVASHSSPTIKFCTSNLNSPTLQLKIDDFNVSSVKDCLLTKSWQSRAGANTATFKYYDKCGRSMTYPCTFTVPAGSTMHSVTPCTNCTEGSAMTMVWVALVAVGISVVALVSYFLYKSIRSGRRSSSDMLDKSSFADLSSFQNVRLAKSKSGIDIAVRE